MQKSWLVCFCFVLWGIVHCLVTLLYYVILWLQSSATPRNYQTHAFATFTEDLLGGFPLSRNFYVHMHVNFTRVNKIETRFDVFHLNVKLSKVQLLLVRAIFHALPLLFANLNFKHVRQNYVTEEINPYGEILTGDMALKRWHNKANEMVTNISKMAWNGNSEEDRWNSTLSLPNL